jgi:hypothetical protein
MGGSRSDSGEASPAGFARHAAIPRLTAAMAVTLFLGLPAHARADLVAGRGRNCGAVWDTLTAVTTESRKGSTLICADGDASCDADGETNGVCVVRLNACVGQVTPSCPSPQPTRSPLRFRGARLEGFRPPDTSTPGCGTEGQLTVPLRRIPTDPRKPLKRLDRSRTMKLVMKSRGFVDRLLVQCVPCNADVCCSAASSPTRPKELILTVPPAAGDTGNGSDLDIGWSGATHNLPLPGAARLAYCLHRCDGAAVAECVGSGDTGEVSLNGPVFSSPVPLIAASTPACIVARFESPTIDMAFNVSSGEASGTLDLALDVYLGTDSAEICPRCVSSGDPNIGAFGICSPTARNGGAPCRIDGTTRVAGGSGDPTYFLSESCLPQQDLQAGTLSLHLPLTTGTATTTGSLPCPDAAGPQTRDNSCAGTCSAECTGSACIARDAQDRCIDAKGGISQLCCSDRSSTPCFSSRDDGTITRRGTPATDGGTAVFAATFCVPRPSSPLLAATTGVPGPGALLLPARVTVIP